MFGTNIDAYMVVGAVDVESGSKAAFIRQQRSSERLSGVCTALGKGSNVVN